MTPRFQRTRLFRELLALGLALWCVSMAAAPARAAAVAAAPTSTDDVAAQQAFRTGVEAARQERWTDARAAFERAYALSPRPVVLINLAGAQARTGHLIDASKNYRRILAADATPETGSFRRAAADVLPALEARIPRVRLRPSGLAPTDVIRVDGEIVPASTLMEGQPLDPGEHTLAVERAGAERARVLFALTERELHYIGLPLPLPVAPPPQPLAVAAVGSSSGAPASDAAGSASRSRSWLRSPWTWATVGVVVVAGSIATIVLANRPDQLYSGNIPPGQVTIR
jgi:hypothetical protein